SSEPVIPASTAKDDKSSSIHLHPSKSVKPAQTIKTVDEQQSKASENVSIRSKTATRPPVLPSHPTSNGLKSFVTIQQLPSSMPELSTEPHVATTPIDQSGLEKVPEETAIAVQHKNSDSVQGESIADISIQATTEHSTPTRTPGLIRPIT